MSCFDDEVGARGQVRDPERAGDGVPDHAARAEAARVAFGREREDVEVALGCGKRVRVAAASSALADALLAQLGAPPVKIHVREVRPQIEGGELHGLDTFATEKKAPKLEVWMRTAAHAKTVKFRTYLRTLLHEIVHHLDVTLLELDDSFHTEGFFRRESSLVRQLLARFARGNVSSCRKSRSDRRR